MGVGAGRREPEISPDTNEAAWLAWVDENEIPLGDPALVSAFFDRVGDARIVMFGESTHGTSEFYRWREYMSRRLIAEKGFSFVAVEGDWPDCYHVNRFAKDYPDAGASARNVLNDFARWPTWMWANEEVVRFISWLREYNAPRPLDTKAGFYGLDVYSLWDSLHELQGWLSEHAPKALPAARHAFRCFEPYGEDAQRYARSTMLVPEGCENAVIDLLVATRQAVRGTADHHEATFDAEQNARIAANAEAYYRAMVRGGPDSWNVRDRHMMETLARLLEFHGPDAKAIVWAHNTHVGDARATDMAQGGMVNIGQLARERFPDQVVLVGMGTWRGSVIAASEWGDQMRRMEVPRGRVHSFEHLFHDRHPGMFILDDARSRPALLRARGHRAVGVVYHPEWESPYNYVPTILPMRYDVFINIPHTMALHPLHMEPPVGREYPETYPWGE